MTDDLVKKYYNNVVEEIKLNNVQRENVVELMSIQDSIQNGNFSSFAQKYPNKKEAIDSYVEIIKLAKNNKISVEDILPIIKQWKVPEIVEIQNKITNRVKEENNTLEQFQAELHKRLGILKAVNLDSKIKHSKTAISISDELKYPQRPVWNKDIKTAYTEHNDSLDLSYENTGDKISEIAEEAKNGLKKIREDANKKLSNTQNHTANKIADKLKESPEISDNDLFDYIKSRHGKFNDSIKSHATNETKDINNNKFQIHKSLNDEITEFSKSEQTREAYFEKKLTEISTTHTEKAGENALQRKKKNGIN